MFNSQEQGEQIAQYIFKYNNPDFFTHGRIGTTLRPFK